MFARMMLRKYLSSSSSLVILGMTLCLSVCYVLGQSDYSECIRYEFHDSMANSSQVQAIKHNCRRKYGVIEKYTEVNLTTRPLLINTTFECCSNRRCSFDHDCPVNFHCSQDKKCIVSSCTLTDEYDLVINEGSECIFDEDCLFYAPFDKGNWGCIRSCHSHDNSNEDLSCRKCKRCPGEPRDVFNASDNLLWTASAEEDSVYLAAKIPPLAILLNSSEFTLESNRNSAGSHSLTAETTNIIDSSNTSMVTESETATTINPSLESILFVAPATMSSFDEDANDGEVNATTTFTSDDSLIPTTRSPVTTSTNNIGITTVTSATTDEGSILNESGVTEDDSNGNTATTFNPFSTNEAVTEDSFSDHNSSFFTTSLPELSLREPTVIPTSPSVTSLEGDSEEGVTEALPTASPASTESSPPVTHSSPRPIVITRFITDDLEEDAHPISSTYFEFETLTNRFGREGSEYYSTSTSSPVTDYPENETSPGDI